MGIMYEIVVKADFAAAHRLPEYDGNCERLHGHNWLIEVRLRADKLDKLGMVCDFRKAKAIVRGVIKILDHRYLNEVAPFDKVNPTTENVARFIFDEIGKALPRELACGSVTAWESERCGVTYSG
jgi:6-pyruvoyltetrahydropterin/6-carboxytetrahydropterin synthase